MSHTPPHIEPELIAIAQEFLARRQVGQSLVVSKQQGVPVTPFLTGIVFVIASTGHVLIQGSTLPITDTEFWYQYAKAVIESPSGNVYITDTSNKVRVIVKTTPIPTRTKLYAYLAVPIIAIILLLVLLL